MFKKYGIGMAAFMIAIAALAFTRPTAPEIKKGPNATYYFKFNSTHGNEATQSNWSEITASQYSLEPCAATTIGCKLITTSVTGSVGSLRPANVYVNGSSTPINQNEVSGVFNKN